MQYSVYPNVRALVDNALNEPDWNKLENQTYENVTRRSLEYAIQKAKAEWREYTESRSSFSGKRGTKGVVEEYEGPHDYEARIISNIESSILSDDFFKKRFSFVNRQTIGQRVDIPRYLNGDQRCWFAVKRKKKPNRAVRVFTPIGGTCEVTSEEMAVCGALSCAIVEMLEANGINAELWASCCVQGVFENMSTNPHPTDPTWDNLCQLVKLKDSCDYCDYGMVNYVCGNSQFYRNIVFKDRISHGISLMHSGLRFYEIGGSYNFSREYIPEDEDHDSDLDVVVPRIYNIDRAREYIQNNFCGTGSKIGQILNAGEEFEQCA